MYPLKEEPDAKLRFPWDEKLSMLSEKVKSQDELKRAMRSKEDTKVLLFEPNFNQNHEDSTTRLFHIISQQLIP